MVEVLPAGLRFQHHRLAADVGAVRTVKHFDAEATLAAGGTAVTSRLMYPLPSERKRMPGVTSQAGIFVSLIGVS